LKILNKGRLVISPVDKQIKDGRKKIMANLIETIMASIESPEISMAKENTKTVLESAGILNKFVMIAFDQT